MPGDIRHPENPAKIQQILIQTISRPPKAANALELMQTLVNTHTTTPVPEDTHHPENPTKIQQILIQTINPPPKAANARELMQALVNARKLSYDHTRPWRHPPSRKSNKNPANPDSDNQQTAQSRKRS